MFVESGTAGALRSKHRCVRVRLVCLASPVRYSYSINAQVEVHVNKAPMPASLKIDVQHGGQAGLSGQPGIFVIDAIGGVSFAMVLRIDVG